MLTLRLKTGEYLTIGENIVVKIAQQNGDSVELSIQAPREVSILRGKVAQRVLNQQGRKQV